MADKQMMEAFTKFLVSQQDALGRELACDEKQIVLNAWFDGCNYAASEAKRVTDEFVRNYKSAGEFNLTGYVKKIVGIK
jgi:hypothetical protein